MLPMYKRRGQNPSSLRKEPFAKEAMIQAHRAKARELMREADEAEAELGSQL